MIRSLIIDDEQHCISHLSSLLREELAQDVHLMDSFTSLAAGLEGIRKYRPDLVFLDVQLGNEETGFELLKQLTDYYPQIVFTTAYEKYAVQAFRFSAVDYLLKPVDAGDLRQAVKRIQERTPGMQISQKLETLLGNLYNATRRICVPVMSGMVILNIADIVRCESDSNYTTIFLNDQQKLTVAKTLKEFEDMLAEYNFFRVHNSQLINLTYVRSYNKGKGGTVTLKNGTVVEVSTRRKEEFLKKLNL
ncbi:MAG: response regulator transcription factor [Chitinophagaceae bacterium]|nr:response regulator transcription factor [Chitinophagaceae bacterium]